MPGTERPRETESQVSPPFYLAIRWEEWEKKDQFRRVLALCLLAPTQCPRLLVFLYVIFETGWLQSGSGLCRWTRWSNTSFGMNLARRSTHWESDAPVQNCWLVSTLAPGLDVPVQRVSAYQAMAVGLFWHSLICVSPWRRLSGFSEQTDSALPHEV